MIDREELAQELLLRENVRKAIGIVYRKRAKAAEKVLKEEAMIRNALRPLIKEAQAAVASVAKHENTGINALEDLLKNTNLLSVIETGYKSLTTRAKGDPPKGQTKQRRSYMNHILDAIGKSLAPEESRKMAGEDEELGAVVNEEIDIEIGDRPEDDPDFISVEEEEEVEADPKEEFGIEGEDKTGRDFAFNDWGDVEKIVLTTFDNLGNPEDISMFEEYLVKNLVLYFEKYEAELAEEPALPPAATGAVADVGAPVGAAADLEPDLETDVPEFELQEVLKLLDIDDIIENLL